MEAATKGDKKEPLETEHIRTSKSNYRYTPWQITLYSLFLLEPIQTLSDLNFGGCLRTRERCQFFPLVYKILKDPKNTTLYHWKSE